MMEFEEGALIRECYQVEKFLGSGAFAEVWRVKHRYLGRRLAMKVFKQEDMTAEDFEALFHEPRLLFELEHPHIIRVFDAGLLDTVRESRGFFVMEYMAAGSLKSYLRNVTQNGHLVPLEEALRLARQICAGIAFAHSMTPPIIHRDLKPDNIMMGYQRGELCIRIADFGLAKSADPFTLQISSRGSLAYKPPEAFEGYDSTAGDVFALGIILYEMLTGGLPFALQFGGRSERDNVQRVLIDARRLRPAPPSAIQPGVDAALDAIVFRALETDPTKRYPHAADLYAALESYRLDAQTAAASVISPGEPTKAPQNDIQPSATPIPEAAGVPQGDRTAALRHKERALEYGRQAATLPTAIEYLEKALVLDPSLVIDYTFLLEQWRKGIVL